ncbi:CHC1 [Symbiodinium microadriaticum]|nr:CHC1 [Symbiodinium microadriaticum]
MRRIATLAVASFVSYASATRPQPLLEYSWLFALQNGVYQKNKRYKQAIELARNDKMYKDCMDSALASGNQDLVRGLGRVQAETLLKYFVDSDMKECFAACLYTCYDLIRRGHSAVAVCFNVPRLPRRELVLSLSGAALLPTEAAYAAGFNDMGWVIVSEVVIQASHLQISALQRWTPFDLAFPPSTDTIRSNTIKPPWSLRSSDSQ